MNNGKICIPVCARVADELILKMRRAEKLADVVEIRFDCLEPEQIGVTKSVISNLKFEKPLLATFRSPDQGGNTSATIEDRIEFWRSNENTFWAGDFEEDVLHASGGWQIRIVSFHDFSGVPTNLDSIYSRLTASDADIVKIAVRANAITDLIPLWKLLDRAKADDKRLVPIAMGDAGKLSRILGLAHGAFLTYASLDAGNSTADGQITANDMTEVYRVKELDAETVVFGVIGDPISQSLSPYMHNPAFVAVGINAVFAPLLVTNLDEFIRRMVSRKTREIELNFGGFSVTMPHKQAIMRHLDAIDPVAAKIGAVNTVKIEGGKLTGYNTDAHGFITPLKSRFGDLKGSRIAVIGAGGAARAAVFALKESGADVTVFARDVQKAEALANEFNVKVEELTTDHRPLTTVPDIIVDATPLGMKGPLENETLFTADELAGVRFVYDLVTKSADTPLIREAKLAGIPAIGGLEMLIAQGAKQFEIWTGREAPVEMMKAGVTEKLK